MQKMKLEKNKNYIDNYCWRCRVTSPKQDIRINIRDISVFEGMRIPLNGLYYLIYNCFLNQYTIGQSYNEILKFSDIMKIQNISQKLIIKIFRQLRQLIKLYYHKYWVHNPLGIEPAENSNSHIEIDESKVIG